MDSYPTHDVCECAIFSAEHDKSRGLCARQCERSAARWSACGAVRVCARGGCTRSTRIDPHRASVFTLSDLPLDGSYLARTFAFLLVRAARAGRTAPRPRSDADRPTLARIDWLSTNRNKQIARKMHSPTNLMKRFSDCQREKDEDGRMRNERSRRQPQRRHIHTRIVYWFVFIAVCLICGVTNVLTSIVCLRNRLRYPKSQQPHLQLAFY